MKTMIKRGTGLLLILTLLLSLNIPVFATEADLTTAVQGSAKYMLNTVCEPQVGSVGGEWAVIGLARSGYDVPQKYWDDYYATVEDYVEEHKGNLHDKKYTEYSRLIVALTAIGADPSDVAGYNLLTPLGDFDKTIYIRLKFLSYQKNRQAADERHALSSLLASVEMCIRDSL